MMGLGNAFGKLGAAGVAGSGSISASTSTSTGGGAGGSAGTLMFTFPIITQAS